jgi:uncharacterized membrane protein YeiH
MDLIQRSSSIGGQFPIRPVAFRLTGVSGGFRRSSLFGIVGVFVVVALAAAGGGEQSDWLCDLWPAELLAAAL